MNNNYKIVYKKPTEYDNDSQSTIDTYAKQNNINTKPNLDDSVFTNDSDNNSVFSNGADNFVLRNNIDKEINKNIGEKNNNGNEEKILSKNLSHIHQNLNNDLNHEKILNNFFEFASDNNFDFENPEPTLLNNLIKSFIIENKLSEENIIVLLNGVKKELYYLNNIKTNPNPNPTNSIPTDSNDNEYFTNTNTNTNTHTQIEMTNASVLDSLKNNDINTWIFVGIILISFVIVIMIVIHKK